MGSRKLDLSQLCWTGGLGFAWILSISLLLYRMTVKKKKKKKKAKEKNQNKKPAGLQLLKMSTSPGGASQTPEEFERWARGAENCPQCCTRITESHQTPQEPRIDAKTVRNFITSSSRDSLHTMAEVLPVKAANLFLYCIAGEAGREA